MRQQPVSACFFELHRSSHFSDASFRERRRKKITSCLLVHRSTHLIRTLRQQRRLVHKKTHLWRLSSSDPPLPECQMRSRFTISLTFEEITSVRTGRRPPHFTVMLTIPTARPEIVQKRFTECLTFREERALQCVASSHGNRMPVAGGHAGNGLIKQ